MSANLDEFNIQVTRVIARLYESHPRPLTIESDMLWDPPLAVGSKDYEEKSSTAGGTLTWLYRNGIVGGDFQEAGIGARITSAQLTSRGYRIVQKSEGNYGGSTLGEVAVAFLSDPAAPGFSQAVDFIARRMSE